MSEEGSRVLSRLRGIVAPIRHILAAPLVSRGVSADTVTLAAIPLAVAAATLIALRFNLLGFGLALLAAAVDFVDGEVARLQGRVTPFGDLLDAVVDRIVEGLLLAALALRMPLPAALALALGALVSYIKARVGLVIAADNRDWPGLGDRADRVALVLVAVLVDAPIFASSGGTVWAERVLWLLVMVSGVGCVQRMLHARALIAAERSSVDVAQGGPHVEMPNEARRGRAR